MHELDNSGTGYCLPAGLMGGISTSGMGGGVRMLLLMAVLALEVVVNVRVWGQHTPVIKFSSQL